MDDRILEQIYQENLEERLIAHLAEVHGFTLEKAMDSQVPPAKPGACICEPLKAAESWAA